jgi:hypothetical protein
VGIATGLTAEGWEFESRYGQEFSLLHVVQTGSGVHPTSYPVRSGGSFPAGESGRGVKMTTHLQLVQRSRKCESLYIHSPMSLHGVVLN